MRGLLVGARVLDEHTDRRGQVGSPLVQVRLDRSVEVSGATQLELLADLRRQVGDGLLDGGVTDLGGLEGVDVGGLRGGSRGNDLVSDRLEFGVLRNEVGLGVQLDQRAVLRHDQTLGGGPLGALTDVLGALDAQQLDGPFEIAVGFDQRVLAVEHACTGQVPQSLDVGSGVVRHVFVS